MFETNMIMKLYVNPGKTVWPKILQRPPCDNKKLRSSVSAILNDVQVHGDDAVKKYESISEADPGDILRYVYKDMTSDLKEQMNELELRKSLKNGKEKS